MKKNLLNILILTFFIPAVSLANGPTFASVTNSWVGLLNALIGLIASAAVLFFFWGMAMVILGSGDTNKVAEGKQRIVWSLLGLVVMFSIWGILRFVQASLFEGSSSGTPSSQTTPTNAPRGLGPL